MLPLAPATPILYTLTGDGTHPGIPPLGENMGAGSEREQTHLHMVQGVPGFSFTVNWCSFEHVSVTDFRPLGGLYIIFAFLKGNAQMHLVPKCTKGYVFENKGYFPRELFILSNSRESMFLETCEL